LLYSSDLNMLEPMEILDKDYADPPELRHQIEKAMNGLAAVTAVHQGTFRIDKAAWSVNLDTGTIVFTTPQGMLAEAPVQIIGTYNTEDGSWLWGWDHPSVPPAVGEHARQMLHYGQEHDLARLTTLTFACTEQACWELTALAFLLCRANGAYCGPAGSARVFMTFGKITLTAA
jgi:hypothetical protein